MPSHRQAGLVERSKAAGSLPTRARSSGRLLAGLVLVAGWILVAFPSLAVLFYGTADALHNTSAPTGDLADSGWQFQGRWGQFLGTPIAPRYFITAKHVGGIPGQVFTFQGVEYPTSAWFDDPASDLRIWRVCGTFPDFAPLYGASNEVGRALVVFGRGTRRGAAVMLTNVNEVMFKGWRWGPGDGVMRWGQNTVESVIDADAMFETNGLGNLLKATFDADGSTNECHLSTGDSGGGVFVRDDLGWRLAGINYSVDGPYRYNTNTAAFDAALVDQGGFYTADANGQWVLVRDLPRDDPGAFYATRIVSNLPWIESILSLAIPPDDEPVLQSAATATGPYRDDSGGAVAGDTLTIARIPGAAARFYRLRACQRLRIVSMETQADQLVLRYEPEP